MFAVYWMGAAAVLVLIEILTLGLTSIWFAGGAVLAAAAAFLGAPLLLQMVIFVAVSCLLFFFTRPLAQKYMNSSVEKTNVEAMIGQHGIVKEAINNQHGKGLVYVNGMDWTARSMDGEEIPEDVEVVIHKIQGVKLIVKALPVPKKKEKEEFYAVSEEAETEQMPGVPIDEKEIPEIWREEEEETPDIREEETEPIEMDREEEAEPIEMNREEETEPIEINQESEKKEEELLENEETKEDDIPKEEKDSVKQPEEEEKEE